jgi:hypothetical protein
MSTETQTRKFAAMGADGAQGRMGGPRATPGGVPRSARSIAQQTTDGACGFWTRYCQRSPAGIVAISRPLPQ